MSRYNIPSIPAVYGFDEPLSQYFLSVGNQQLVGPLSKKYGDNYTMIETLKKAGLWDRLPENHQKAIQDDFPF